MDHASNRDLLAELIAEVRALRRAVEQLSAVQAPPDAPPPAPTSASNGQASRASAVATDLATGGSGSRSVTAQAWLATRGVAVLRARDVSAGADADDQLADRFGRDFTRIAKLLTSLRSNLSTGQRTHLAMGEATLLELTVCTGHASQLAQLGIITNYAYDKKTRTLSFDPPRVPRHINLLSGGWLERYTASVLQRVASSAGLRADALSNVQVRFGDGSLHELDLFAVVDGQPLLVECKTRASGQDYERFLRHRSRLGVKAPRAVFVTLSPDEANARLMSQRWGLTVVNVTGLEPTLRRLLAARRGTPAAAVPGVDEADPSATMVGNSEDGEE